MLRIYARITQQQGRRTTNFCKGKELSALFANM